MDYLLKLTWDLWFGNVQSKSPNSDKDVCLKLSDGQPNFPLIRLNPNCKILHLSISSDGKTHSITPYLVRDAAAAKRIELSWRNGIDENYMCQQGAIRGETFQIFNNQYKTFGNPLKDILLFKEEIDNWFNKEKEKWTTMIL